MESIPPSVVGDVPNEVAWAVLWGMRLWRASVGTLNCACADLLCRCVRGKIERSARSNTPRALTAQEHLHWGKLEL